MNAGFFGLMRKDLLQIGATQNDFFKCQAQNCPRLNNRSCCAAKFSSDINGSQKSVSPTEAAVPPNQRRRRAILLCTVVLQLLVLLTAGSFLLDARRNQNRVPDLPINRVTSTAVNPKKPTPPIKANHDAKPEEPKTLPPQNAKTAQAHEEKKATPAVIPPPIAEPSPKVARQPKADPRPLLTTAPIPPPREAVTPTPIPSPIVPAVPVAPKQVPDLAQTPPKRPLEETRLDEALKRLEKAERILTTAPDRSLDETLRAFTIFHEIKRQAPPVTFWMLGQAYAALSWGATLLDNVPAIEELVAGPDGRHVAIQLRDGSVLLRNLADGLDDGMTLSTDSDRFVTLRFSPDRRLLVGGQTDGSIRIWNLAHRHPTETVLQLRENVSGLTTIDISPNGRWLVAYGTPSSQAKALSAPSATQNIWLQQVAYILRGHKNVSSVAGDFTDSTPVIWLWDLQRLHEGTLPVATLLYGPSERNHGVRDCVIHALVFSENSAKLAAACSDGTACVYNLGDKAPNHSMTVLRGHRFDVTALAFGPDGKWLATGSRDNAIRLWNLQGVSPPESVVLDGHIGWISALTVNAQGDTLYSGSYDKTIRIWDISLSNPYAVRDKEPQVLQNEQGVIQEILLSPDESKLISRGGDGSLRIQNLDGPKDHRHSILFRNRMLPINRVTVTPDGSRLIFSYINQRDPAKSGVRVWPLEPERLAELASEVKASAAGENK